VKVRYTRRALQQLTEILDYIDDRSPQGAEKVKRRLQATIGRLAEHPNSGRATNNGDLRRVVANPYPYVIFYRPSATEIVIYGIRHAARRPR
jgi:plasmid stabilization system protein ParE